MSKVMITRIFVAGVVAVVVATALEGAAAVAALAEGGVAIGGPDVVSVDVGALAWPLLVLVVGLLATAAGAIAVIVSWIGALYNTAQLEDKTWFVALLALGLLSFGFVAMVAYVALGPDARHPDAGPAGSPDLAGS